jgi:hypothetical protein
MACEPFLPVFNSHAPNLATRHRDNDNANDEISNSGDKSLELVQALQVVTIWYWKEANGDSKYYQLVHMAATMAIDLRLNKNVEVKRPPLFDLQQPRSFVSDTASLECRRAWLGCYLLTSR